MVAGYKGDETSFTAAVRVFSMSYFRAASTEEGHRLAGHGSAFLFSAKKDFSAFIAASGTLPVAAPVPPPQNGIPRYANGRP
jgi:hypothetical protein